MAVVTHIPLKSLICEESSTEYVRSRYLTLNELKQLLAGGEIQFVTSNIGSKNTWHNKSKCYEHWKSEVQPHLAEDIEMIDVTLYPGKYAYIASLWESVSGSGNIVLLEVYH